MHRSSNGFISFDAQHGHQDTLVNPMANWRLEPTDPARALPQAPLPERFNLWLFRGNPPINGQEVEIVIADFKFIPEAAAI